MAVVTEKKETTSDIFKLNELHPIQLFLHNTKQIHDANMAERSMVKWALTTNLYISYQSNTLPDPRAVVVKSFDAIVADGTM